MKREEDLKATEEMWSLDMDDEDYEDDYVEDFYAMHDDMSGKYGPE